MSHGYDGYGRLLGVLWLEDREESVNMLMLLNGWARASDSEARLTVGDFTDRDAESCALSKGIGIWAWSA